MTKCGKRYKKKKVNSKTRTGTNIFVFKKKNKLSGKKNKTKKMPSKYNNKGNSINKNKISVILTEKTMMTKKR